MAIIVAIFLFVLLQGVDSQTYTVTIDSNPAGIPIDGMANTFDYPILSSVTLTCNVTSNDGSSFTVSSYQWNDAGCYNNSKFTNNDQRCFPLGQTSQTVTDNVIAHDAGTTTCTVIISGSDYTSEPFTLRISGVAVTKVLFNTDGTVRSRALTPDNAVTDYSYINARDGDPNGRWLVRCLTGLGPTSTSSGANGVLGGFYVNGNMIPNSGEQGTCSSDVIQIRSGSDIAGIINFHQCEAFSTTAEGIYTCTMMNSSMMDQSVRFGVYFTGRTAPVIDTLSSSTVTVNVGSSLTLSCTSRGSPPDRFTWRKDNDLTVLQSTSITAVDHTSTSAVFRADYSIDNVDSGIYTCTVTNPIGSDSAIITVDVDVPITCPSLINPNNGIISCLLGGDGVPNAGETCTFTCNTGYGLTGSGTRTCQSDGSWSGSDATCNRITCPSLTDPNNGMITCSPESGGVSNPVETCTFTCDTGYELIINRTRTCQNNGSWSGIDAMCRRATGSHSSDSSSDDMCSSDDSGVIIALAALLAIAVIGLVICVVVIVFLVKKLKQLRYDVNQSNIRYSDVKQSKYNTIRESTNEKRVKPSEPEYEALETDPKAKMKVDCDVKMDTNPAYQCNVKMDTNPAYQATS